MGRKREPRLYEAFGQLKTIREWSEDHRCQVDRLLLKGRLQHGWSAEDAIATPKVETLYEAFGEHKTLGGWCADPRCQTTMRNLIRRMELQWDFEKCLTTPQRVIARAKNKKEPKPRLPHGRAACFTAFGETKSLKQWALDPRCAVRYDHLRNRLRVGWALEEAITVPRWKGSPIPVHRIKPTSDSLTPLVQRDEFVAFGESKSLEAWVGDTRCKVALETVKRRLANGMPLETAITAQRMSAGPGALPTYEAFGEIKTAREWAKDPRCVVSSRLLCTRLAQGKPVEEALTRPRAEDPAPIKAFGERKRIFEWALDERCTVSFKVLAGRLKIGWTIEEAILAPFGSDRPSRPKKPERKKPPPRVIKLYECFGERKSMTNWVKDPRSVVASAQALRYRLDAGVPFQDALTLAQIPNGPRPRAALLRAFGEEKTFAQWAKDPRCVVSATILNSRLNRGGWPLERALTEPNRYHH